VLLFAGAAHGPVSVLAHLSAWHGALYLSPVLIVLVGVFVVGRRPLDAAADPERSAELFRDRRDDQHPPRGPCPR